MAAPRPRRRALARAEEIEYERILFFSDAIFAIAITLLIVDLQVPDVAHVESGQQLRETLPQSLDRSLVLLNLLFLGCIAFLPYPTSLLSAAGDQVPATVFYAASIAAAGLAEAAVWLYAIHIRDLALPGVPRSVRRWVLLRILPSPVVFLGSIPLAIRQPILAQYLWLLVLFSVLVVRHLEPPRPTRPPPRAATPPIRSKPAERWVVGLLQGPGADQPAWGPATSGPDGRSRCPGRPRSA
jgi:hypothetical protein